MTAPDTIEHDGARFRRARWRRKYPGVVDQYREDVPRNSRHLFVMADGSRRVVHVDKWNPDHGYAVSHFLGDHPAGRALRTLGAIALLGRRFL